MEEVLAIQKEDLEHARAFVNEVEGAKQGLEERVQKLRTQLEDKEVQCA